MSYYLDSLEKFNQLPLAIRNKVGNFDTMDDIQSLETEYQVDLKFVIILVMINEILIDDIPYYLKTKYNLDEKTGQLIKHKLLRKVFNNIAEEEYLNAKDLVLADWLRTVLKSRLKETLSSPQDNLRLEVNKKLMYNFMFGAGLPEDEALETVEKNTELLTSANLIVSEMEAMPSISNWIKYLKQKGLFEESEVNFKNRLEFFNKDRYFISLSDEDKGVIRRLVEFYRTLKYFPEAFGSLPVNDWKFIPLSGQFQSEEPEIVVDYHTDESQVLKAKVINQAFKSENISEKMQTLFKDNLEVLVDKYQITEGLKEYEKQTLDELIKILEVNFGQPEVVLPVLMLIAKKDKELVSLIKNSKIKNQIASNLKDSNKDFNLKNIFKSLLSACQLSDQEAMIFTMNLAKTNQTLAGLVYGDLKTQSFNWA